MASGGKRDKDAAAKSKPRAEDPAARGLAKMRELLEVTEDVYDESIPNLDALLKDKAKLTAILTYHVVAGNVPSSEVVKLKSAKTVNGQDVQIKVMDGKVMVNNAHVVTADVKASNGVIHVIDTVILPREK